MPPAKVHRLSGAVQELVAAMEAGDVHAEFFFAEE
jgi:hypothetical protein